MSLPVNIHEVPFFRLLIPLITGVILQVLFDVFPAKAAVAIIPIVAFALLVVGLFLFQQWQHRWFFGTTLNIFLVTCGLVLAVDFSYDNTLVNGREYKVLLRLLDDPQLRARTTRAKCQIQEVVVDQQFKPSQEKILLYFSSTDSLASRLRYGDIIATTINPRAFDNPKNPYQFDVRQYMKQESIRFSSFIPEGNWLHCGQRTNRVVAYSLRLRDHLVSLFKMYSIKDQELAVISALTLGYRELLDDEIQKVYSATGAMHILSVSGLHVGILYFLLSFILGAIPAIGKVSKSIKLIVALLFLWFFAMLTGLSPSVCRAALMFSFVAIGQGFGVRSNIINTLSAAAFVLLVANPFNLLNVGFQLSFLAVLSIVVFYPPVYGLFFLKNKAVDYVWSLVAVSIAAQLGTFPLSAAYFSQFPNYFIITNLIAIPLSTIILYMAVLLLAISPFAVLAAWLGKLLNGLLLLMNNGLEWIEGLPFALSSGIHITTVQLTLLTLAIVLLAVFIAKWRISILQAILALIIVVMALNIGHQVDVSKAELVIFSMPKRSVICYRGGGVANFIHPDTLSNDMLKEYGFYLSGYVNHQTRGGKFRQVHLYSSTATFDENLRIRANNGVAMVDVGGISVVLPYNDSVKHLRTGRPVDVDILLVNRYFSSSILACVSPKMVIIDGSFSRWKQDKLLVELAVRNITVRNLNSEGFYRRPLN